MDRALGMLSLRCLRDGDGVETGCVQTGSNIQGAEDWRVVGSDPPDFSVALREEFPPRERKEP